MAIPVDEQKDKPVRKTTPNVYGPDFLCRRDELKKKNLVEKR